jgi:hypothetical protein
VPTNVVVHYWHSHSEHCRSFATLLEAVDFLLHGMMGHEFAADRITGSDGTLIVAREALNRALQMSEGERHAWMSDVEVQHLRG